VRNSGRVGGNARGWGDEVIRRKPPGVARRKPSGVARQQVTFLASPRKVTKRKGPASREQGPACGMRPSASLGRTPAQGPHPPTGSHLATQGTAPPSGVAPAMPACGCPWPESCGRAAQNSPRFGLIPYESGAQTGCAALFRPQAPGCGGIERETSTPKPIPLLASPTSGGGVKAPPRLRGGLGWGGFTPLDKGGGAKRRGIWGFPPLGCLGRGLELGDVEASMSEHVAARAIFPGGSCEFASRPIQDADRGLPRHVFWRGSTAGPPFFGYFLWRSKESD